MPHSPSERFVSRFVLYAAACRSGNVKQVTILTVDNSTALCNKDSGRRARLLFASLAFAIAAAGSVVLRVRTTEYATAGKENDADCAMNLSMLLLQSPACYTTKTKTKALGKQLVALASTAAAAQRPRFRGHGQNSWPAFLY